jgi:hypothetical protein
MVMVMVRGWQGGEGTEKTGKGKGERCECMLTGRGW